MVRYFLIENPYYLIILKEVILPDIDFEQSPSGLADRLRNDNSNLGHI